MPHWENKIPQLEQGTCEGPHPYSQRAKKHQKGYESLKEPNQNKNPREAQELKKEEWKKKRERKEEKEAREKNKRKKGKKKNKKWEKKGKKRN